MNVKDALNRPIRDIRISVTDRCNYRCAYCMPNEEYDWVNRDEILSFEEIACLTRIFAGLGTEKVRLTGGEPLVRKDVHELVRMLARLPGIRDVSLTTNGALLAEQMPDLSAAGLKRINISLDTLDAAKFRTITQRGELAPVLNGIVAARKAGLQSIKINCVVIRKFNDDEIIDLADFARRYSLTMRFIEYMDVGDSNEWRFDRVVPKREILEILRARFPIREIGRADGRAPAVDYKYEDGRGVVGVIGSVTEPFCGTCDRARLTADGKLVTCLFSNVGHDLKTPLRLGESDEKLSARIADIWTGRRDRFSDDRWGALKTRSGYDPKQYSKIEMIRLGG